MVAVKAACDIRTVAGFTVAKAGTQGLLLEGAIPSLPHNHGKVLIRFNGRERGYWGQQRAPAEGLFWQPPKYWFVCVLRPHLIQLQGLPRGSVYAEQTRIGLVVLHQSPVWCVRSTAQFWSDPEA